MTDENGTPKDPGAPTPDEPKPETPAGDGQAADTAADKPAATAADKPKLSDEEKAAKIAAAKAKAAAKKAEKAAAAGKDDAEAAPPEEKPPWEDKPVPPAHEDASDDPDVTALGDAVAGAVLAADRYAGDVTVTVAAEHLEAACTFLKTEKDYTFLVDLTAVDWPEREGDRFDVIYWLHRFSDSKRLRLIATTAETIASVSTVWKSANWMEREAYDMFGILFEGHPGLERILTWEGFNGHPLRKDFPVEGIDTGAAIYPDVYPPGGGPHTESEEADA